MFIIAAIALIFIGPKQLPEVARTIARFLNEWRNTTSDITHTLMTSDLPPPQPYLEHSTDPITEDELSITHANEIVDEDGQLSLVEIANPEPKSPKNE